MSGVFVRRAIVNLCLACVVAFQGMLAGVKPYKGAELRTRASYLYGRFEVRLKSVQREGVLCSFFTYHDGDTQSNWNEIDIEILGRYTDDVQFNTITPGQVNHVSRRQMQSSPHMAFHTYAFEWTPGYVAWFIDGMEVCRQTGSHIQTMNKSQKIMMNIWNPEAPGWVGEWNEKVLPAFAYYDWVSYSSYTPGTGSTGTGNNFTPFWRDDFNSYDASRWDKGTHTWTGNGCDFVAENAYFKDGQMILCLTDQFNLGYVDKNPPSLLWGRQEESRIVAAFSEELDQTSAESFSSYVVTPTITLRAAKLLADGKTVEFEVSGLDTATSYNLIVLGVNDRAVPPNRSSAHAKMLNRSVRLQFPIRINVGGSASGGYLADKAWNEKVEYGYLDGSTKLYPSSLDIAGTTEPEIYRSERWGLVYYKIRVPRGSYRVTLMMAENYWNVSAARVFDVSLEGRQVLTALDVYQQAGKNKALQHTITGIQVNDGILDIHFGATTDQPILNGLTIEQELTGLEGESLEAPDQFRFHQNYPNPFNEGTIMSFTLHASQAIRFSVHDVLGRSVAAIDLGIRSAGDHRFYWRASDENGASLSSGVYYCTLASTSHRDRRKIVVLR